MDFLCRRLRLSAVPVDYACSWTSLGLLVSPMILRNGTDVANCVQWAHARSLDWSCFAMRSCSKPSNKLSMTATLPHSLLHLNREVLQLSWGPRASRRWDAPEARHLKKNPPGNPQGALGGTPHQLTRSATRNGTLVTSLCSSRNHCTCELRRPHCSVVQHGCQLQHPCVGHKFESLSHFLMAVIHPTIQIVRDACLRHRWEVLTWDGGQATSCGKLLGRSCL